MFHAEQFDFEFMKERPILFNGEMVRALLDGRKSQTRRVIKPQPVLRERKGMEPVWDWAARNGVLYTSQNVMWLPITKAFEDFIEGGYSPYGQPGDRLWVRETWRIVGRMATEYMVQYKADKSTQTIDVGWEGPSPALDAQIHQEKFHPSIHMPRWASRITLEVVNVRVERVQSISEEDALAEGVFGDETPYDQPSPSMCYHALWNSINSSRGFGWDVNPWVWVVEFKRVEAGK